MILISLMLVSLLFTFWQSAAYGSPMSIGITILLSLVTIGGTWTANNIMSKLTVIDANITQLNRKFERLDQRQNDSDRRIGDVEKDNKERDKSYNTQSNDIARLKQDAGIE